MTDLERARLVINEADKNIAQSFEKRMQASKSVAEYKMANNLPIFDASREKQVIENAGAFVEDDTFRPYHAALQRELIELSKQYQSTLLYPDDTRYEGVTPTPRAEDGVYPVKSGYDIVIRRGSLNNADKIFDLDRKVMVVTDTGVPIKYTEAVANKAKAGYIHTIPAGEQSKTMDTVQCIAEVMVKCGFSRNDCIVAVGGGVVGDIAGFTASMYMRGIDFCVVPTTVLSQVDSSVGGKVAVDFMGWKNLLGAFWQPKGVLVDTDTLATLPPRQVSAGLAEALKTGVLGDRELFELFESGDITENLDEIVTRSVLLKREICERDPNEKGIRKILNFGHTVGHGIEAAAEGALLHGECVALGMLFVCTDEIRERLIKIYDRIGLTETIGKYYDDISVFGRDKLLSAMMHDKKSADGVVSAVICDKIGSCRIEKRNLSDMI